MKYGNETAQQRTRHLKSQQILELNPVTLGGENRPDQSPAFALREGKTPARAESKDQGQERDEEMAQQNHRPRSMCQDRKSTRLNSSHRCISYAVFCLKKKNRKIHEKSCKRHTREQHKQSI